MVVKYIHIGDIMLNIKNFIKSNYKFIILIISLLLIFLTPMPYYIEAPGGITSLDNKVTIGNKKIDGSYNLSYVAEYRGSIPMLIYAYFNKDFDIYKKEEILLEEETNSEYLKRDKLYLEQSISNAVIAAYKQAGKTVNINSSYLYVGYILENSDTNLEIGDCIIKINGLKITSKEEVNKLLNGANKGDKLDIVVLNDGKEYKKEARVITEDGKNLIGIVPIEVIDYDVLPEVEIIMAENESGGSGGLMLSLAIYDLLSDNNLAKGRKIAGTGTIEADGSVGKIGGIEYKIKGAVKDSADIFFVPDENYEEAVKVKKENNYKLKLVKVSTLKEAINYLE